MREAVYGDLYFSPLAEFFRELALSAEASEQSLWNPMKYAVVLVSCGDNDIPHSFIAPGTSLLIAKGMMSF